LLCPWERHLMLYPTLRPSSLPVVVVHPDERHANRTASVWLWQTQSIVQHFLNILLWMMADWLHLAVLTENKSYRIQDVLVFLIFFSKAKDFEHFWNRQDFLRAWWKNIQKFDIWYLSNFTQLFYNFTLFQKKI